MNKKLIFFDIDGTLLDEQSGSVPASTIEAIEKAQKNGHLCFINTGRPISTIDKIITDLPFDGYVCGCGTYIEYQQKILFHTELDFELRKKVIQSIDQYQVDAMLEGKSGVYFSQHLKHPFIQAIKKKLENDFLIIQRDIDFLEIVPLPYSKATGIQYLIDHLGYTLKDTISMGDSLNDLPMLTYTHESVAMGNSHPLLLDQVTYITTPVNQDGIQHALEHFHLI